jgi:hypothetical protein
MRAPAGSHSRPQRDNAKLPALKSLRFSDKARIDLSDNLRKLGFPRETHAPIIECLIDLAERHHPLFVSGARAPTIAAVRHALQMLVAHLQTGAELSSQLPGEVWNALLGAYPASRFDLVLPEHHVGRRASGANERITFPFDVPISNHVLAAALSRAKTHVELHRANNPEPRVLMKLFWPRMRRIEEVELKAAGFRSFGSPASCQALFFNRMAKFDRDEKDQLCRAVQWSIDRLEATCIPASRSNPGKRTTARWQRGFLERVLVAKIIAALWPERVPDAVAIETLSDLINLVRWKLFAAIQAEFGVDVVRHKRKTRSDPIEPSHVSGTLRLIRKRVVLQRQLDALWKEMDNLNRQNVRLHATIGGNPEISATIQRNASRVTEIDTRYSALTSDLREVERRLETGDYHPKSRRNMPRITGRPP